MVTTAFWKLSQFVVAVVFLQREAKVEDDCRRAGAQQSMRAVSCFKTSAVSHLLEPKRGQRCQSRRSAHTAVWFLDEASRDT